MFVIIGDGHNETAQGTRRTAELVFGTDFPSEIRCARDFVNFTGQARIKD